MLDEQTPSNDQNITLDKHLLGLGDLLHKLNAARNHDTLTPDTLRQTIEDAARHARRDFPPEATAPITEDAVADLLAGYWNRVATRKVAAPSGLARLDKALNGGFQAKRLVTLLGAPGGGKTSLANQWAERVASERPVLYCTSEDSADVLISKTLAWVGNVDYSAVLYGWEKCADEINQAIEILASRSSARNLRYLDISAGMIDLAELRDRAAAHFEGKPGPGLIVVDYLQRMARAIRDSAGTKELREAVTQLTERLRAIACELDCTVLAVASMNRASGYGKSSEANALSSAKESGDIEYTADVMMALAEDAKRIAPNLCEARVLRIDKNRQGPITTIKLDWRADRQSFTEVCDE